MLIKIFAIIGVLTVSILFGWCCFHICIGMRKGIAEGFKKAAREFVAHEQQQKRLKKMNRHKEVENSDG